MDTKEKLIASTKTLTAEFIKSMAEYGVKNDIDESSAYKISAQAVLGSAALVVQSDDHPEELVDKVCSPGGTTIEGLLTLKKEGFDGAVINSID